LLLLLFLYTPNEHKLNLVIGVVLSSPMIQPTQPVIETEQSAETTNSSDVDTPMIVQTENVPIPSHSNNVNEPTTSTGDKGVTNNAFLTVSSAPVGRSSRYVLISDISRVFNLLRYNSYHEELEEVIDYGDPITTTSPDYTETEASDADKPNKKKNRPKSRLPWSTSSDIGLNEAKVSSIFSFTSAPGEDGKITTSKKLRRKKRPKEEDVHPNAIGIALNIGRPTSLKSPDSENDQRLSPRPWTHQNNISQSSLNASDFSRHSHISSNRSSVDVPRRSEIPIERHGPPTTFAEIQHSHLSENYSSVNDDDLPTKVMMPATRAEKPRSSSQSSIQSAGSSGKRSKIRAWLRKKRGVSVSSSGGGSSVVSD
jgi:hypothetical protein